MKAAVALLALMSLSYIHAQANNTRQNFFTGGGCASIPGLGSPIHMIANGHKYIEDALNIKNPYTSVKYIHFVTETPFSTALRIYRLGFSITDLNSTKYVGIEFTQAPVGIGSVKINKFLMTTDFKRMIQLIDKNMKDNAPVSCGDLKFVYSSYGTDPTAKLNYAFPGRNQNSGGLSILNQLNATPNKPNNTKICITVNFNESVNFFGLVPAGIPSDLLRCLPSKPAIAAIKIGCVANAVTSIQLTFNNLNDGGTTESNFIGAPLTPASSITTIDLKNAETVSITSFSTPNSLNIKTFDINGNNLLNYSCGVGITAPKNIIMTVNDFLGFTRIFTNGVIIQSFQLTQYKP